MRALTSGSISSSPVFRSTNSAIGTPHARWRLITQSGRPSTIEPMRLRPFSGTKRVSAMASARAARSVGPSAATSHRAGVVVRSPLARRSSRNAGRRAAAWSIGDEPLRGAAEDHLGLRSPAVRVAVLKSALAASSAPASRKSEQIGPSGALNLVLMTLPWPPQPRQSVAVEAAVIDHEHRVDPGRLAQLEVLLAMVRRHVDQARALVGGDDRPGATGAARRRSHRACASGAGRWSRQVGALSGPDVLHAAQLLTFGSVEDSSRPVRAHELYRRLDCPRSIHIRLYASSDFDLHRSYSMSSPYAIAWLTGIVHGVVVQITACAPTSSGIGPRRSRTRHRSGSRRCPHIRSRPRPARSSRPATTSPAWRRGRAGRSRRT